MDSKLAEQALRRGQEMRRMQAEFFKTRDQTTLRKVKAIEKEFDALAKEALAGADLFSPSNEEAKS